MFIGYFRNDSTNKIPLGIYDLLQAGPQPAAGVNHGFPVEVGEQFHERRDAQCYEGTFQCPSQPRPTQKSQGDSNLGSYGAIHKGGWGSRGLWYLIPNNMSGNVCPLYLPRNLFHFIWKTFLIPCGMLLKDVISTLVRPAQKPHTMAPFCVICSVNSILRPTAAVLRRQKIMVREIS